MYKINHADIKEWAKNYTGEPFDAILCDPPYELGFMGKSWDNSGIAFDTDMWKDLFRHIKPGGHLLAFSGSRTYHRMAVAIEDAGFEIRDMMSYIYGSGFPKSLNIQKQMEKKANERAEQNTERGVRPVPDTDVSQTITDKQTTGEVLQSSMSEQSVSLSGKTTSNVRREESSVEGRSNTEAIKGQLQGCPLCEMSSGVSTDGKERRLHNGTQTSDGSTPRQDADKNGSGASHRPQPKQQRNIQFDAICDQCTTQAIRRLSGLGTALKPAVEPICLARKPLDGTVLENVLKHGTGGINIDGSRVEGKWNGSTRTNSPDTKQVYGDYAKIQTEQHPQGRFPANLITDGSDEVVGLFPDTKSGALKSTQYEKPSGNNDSMFAGDGKFSNKGYGADSGSAARFFYTAKPDEPNGRTLIECGYCGKPQEIRLSKKRTHNYCSLDCARKGRTKFNSQEVECAFCGSNFTKKNSQMFTDKHFCSRACMGDWQAKFYIGEKAHNYKGGVTALNKRIRSLAKMTEWRIDVFKRDSYTCQVCGDNAGGNLNAHHKKMLANMIADLNITDLTTAIECEELWDRDNGITLCVECHQDEHNKYAMSRFVYTAKASKSERNQGLEGFELRPGGSNAKGYTADVARGRDRNRPVANHHPTVKPLSLTKYLANLIKPPTGGRLLVPFSGSGSEMIGALQAGWDYVEGVELTEEYIPIAEARIKHWTSKPEQTELV